MMQLFPYTKNTPNKDGRGASQDPLNEGGLLSPSDMGYKGYNSLENTVRAMVEAYVYRLGH